MSVLADAPSIQVKESGFHYRVAYDFILIHLSFVYVTF